MIHSIRQTGGVRPAEANRTLIYRSPEYSFEIHTYGLLYSKSPPSHAGFAYYVLSNTAVVCRIMAIQNDVCSTYCFACWGKSDILIGMYRMHNEDTVVTGHSSHAVAVLQYVWTTHCSTIPLCVNSTVNNRPCSRRWRIDLTKPGDVGLGKKQSDHCGDLDFILKSAFQTLKMQGCHKVPPRGLSDANARHHGNGCQETSLKFADNCPSDDELMTGQQWYLGICSCAVAGTLHLVCTHWTSIQLALPFVDPLPVHIPRSRDRSRMQILDPR